MVGTPLHSLWHRCYSLPTLWHAKTCEISARENHKVALGRAGMGYVVNHLMPSCASVIGQALARVVGLVYAIPATHSSPCLRAWIPAARQSRSKLTQHEIVCIVLQSLGADLPSGVARHFRRPMESP